jgi:hypothetical protein
LNVCSVIVVRQIEIHTAEALVPSPNHLEVEITIVKFRKYISPGSDQIQPELIRGGGEALMPAMSKLINSIWNKEELPD